MFKISDSDNDIEAGHTRSGNVFRGAHLENLFKKNYGEEGFYSGEEVDLTNEEHLEPTRTEEGEVEELRQSEPETLGTARTTEVSNVNPLVSQQHLAVRIVRATRVFKVLLPVAQHLLS
jgi:hypothetical protein